MSGRLTVIGLGPGNADQVTPQASHAVAEASFVYGYKPYLDRLDLRADQTRIASDNREELRLSQPEIAVEFALISLEQRAPILAAVKKRAIAKRGLVSNEEFRQILAEAARRRASPK